MKDFLFHITGACGELHHPSILLLAGAVALGAVLFTLYKRSQRVHN